MNQEMCLWLGTGFNGDPAFADEDEARAAWTRHRERIMADHSGDGRRPRAWWWFEAPAGVEFDYDTERSTLFEANLLEPDEREKLVRYWRVEFERCHKPSFAYCEGPDRWLTGAAARRAHLAWADVPRSLLAEWSKDEVPA